MSHDARIVEFISFCIEMYARARNLSGQEVSARLVRTGGYDYLRKGYDVLHTMGHEWLVEDMDAFFKSRGCVA